MPQLLICIKPDTFGFLKKDKIYTQTGQCACPRCGTVYVCVAGVACNRPQRICSICHKASLWPYPGEAAIFRSRFVPLNDPDFDGADTGEGIRTRTPVVTLP
jgi:hypothetical protein